MLSSRGVNTQHSLDLAYTHLSVRGTGGSDDVVYGATIGAIIAPWTNRKYKKKKAALAAAKVAEDEQGGAGDEIARGEGMVWDEKTGKQPKKNEEGLRQGERYLIKDFNGLVKAGEMMLVVGRPGAGCTTLLKALAGLNQGYAGVDGKVFYGEIEGQKALKPYRSAVIFNAEEGESVGRVTH